MACRGCGKSRTKILAEKSRAAGMEIEALGPFPDHQPAPAEGSTVKPNDTDSAKV